MPIALEIKAMDDEKKAISGLEDALRLLRTGQRNEAIVKCHQIADARSLEPQVMRICARVAHQCGKLECALKWHKGATLLNGTQPEDHLAMGKIYLQMHRFKEAIACFENLLNIDSTRATAYLQLGLCYFENEDHLKAINHFQKSIQNDPNQASPYYWIGIVYSKQSKYKQAIGCLEKARAIDPAFTDASQQLGLLYLKGGKFVQSRDCFYHVISGNNEDWRAWGNLCMVLRELGELEEAKSSGIHATSLNPDSFHVWHNLGNVFKDMGSYHKSISCYEKARFLNPKNDVTHAGLGIAYQCTGDTDRAEKSFKMALKCNPSAGTAINNMLNHCMMECDWDQSFNYEKKIHNLTLESLRAGQVPEETPFVNLSRSDDAELNMAVARAWSQALEAKMSGKRNSLQFQYPRNQRSKIRIGYLSNNFGDHPTAHITRRLYQLHNRSRFEVFCFSYGPEDNSRYRQSIRDGCDKFIDIRELSHVQAAKVINEHGVDILVDLVGFMKGERLAIPALRPAPLQVRWLGMAGTSGADFFDYIITDRIVTPEDLAHCYTEKFVYLPQCYQINDNQPYVDENNCQKSDYGLPEDTFIFCCFNTSYKIDANLFDTWMTILRRLPDSVLWLMASSKNLKDNLGKKAATYGINANRLIFSKKVPKQVHLSRLSLADLVLDTLRINGAASTSDALWASVPVLTIQGKHFASRMSSSILKAAGVPELITHSLKEYESRAVELAEDKSTLKQIQAKLNATNSESHLFATEKFVEYLEKAYAIVWQRYLDGENPCMLDLLESPDEK